MSDVQLLVIIQYINIYIGFFAASIGTIGNILNIITFTCLKKYRTLPSSIFLAGASIGEQLTIIGLLFPQSIGYATGHDPRSMSSPFCRISSVLYTGGGVFALACLYLAAVDRYLQTCRSAIKRQWMTLKRALLLLCIFAFVSISLGLPFGIFRDVMPNNGLCDYINTTFTRFAFYFYAIVGMVSPVALLICFGYLTWRNVQQTQQRQAAGQNSNNIAQQVTRMILIQTASIVISIMPSAAFNLYIVLFNRDPSSFTNAEQLILYIGQITVYTDSCISFYVYLIVSQTFRRSVKKMLGINIGRTNPVIQLTE